jgi:hypothetical protein
MTATVRQHPAGGQYARLPAEGSDLRQRVSCTSGDVGFARDGAAAKLLNPQ